MRFREMRGGDGVSDVEIRRNEIIELLYTYKKYSIDVAQFLNYLLLPFRANRGQQDPKRLVPIILL